MPYSFVCSWLASVLLQVLTSESVNITKIICEGKSGTISCEGEGQKIIRIIDGKYGRSEHPVCIQLPWNSLTCDSASAKTIITDLCDRNISCTVKASNIKFGDPCPGTSKYAEITYTCVEDLTSEAKVTTTMTASTELSTKEATSTTQNSWSTTSGDIMTTDDDTLTATSTTGTEDSATEKSGCDCTCLFLKDNKTECTNDDVDCMIIELRQELIISVKTLSSFKRKMICVYDERISSKVIGMSAVSFLVIFGCFIIIPDITRLLKFIFYYFKQKH